MALPLFARTLQFFSIYRIAGGLASILLAASAPAIGLHAACAPAPLRAENPHVEPYQANLRSLVNHAGLIFSGRVLTVGRSPGRVAAGWVTVSFLVETPVRGVHSGPFTADFLEDAPNALPLDRGERLVLFLHAPNAAGLTSFVAGHCGKFVRTGGDRIDLRQLQVCYLGGLAFPPVASADDSNRPWLQSTAAPPQSVPTRDFLLLLKQLIATPGVADDHRIRHLPLGRLPEWTPDAP